MTVKKLHHHETTKLFYNRYVYCLTVYNSLGSIFRNKNFKFASKELDTLEQSYQQGQPLLRRFVLRETPVEESHFFDAKVIYNELTRYKGNYLLRCEGNTVGFYSNDKIFLENLSKKVTHIKDWYSPDPSVIDFLQTNVDTIIVDDDFGYAYKVVFNNIPVNREFGQWLEKNKDKVKSTKMLREDINLTGYINGRYIYCKSENVLVLLNIIAGNSISKIYKLIHKQDIDK